MENTKWMIEFKQNDSRIYFRNLFHEYSDWVYEDEDRTFELILESGKLAEKYNSFIEYAAWKFGMNEKEEEILDYILRGFNWNDIIYCIDILDNDISQEVRDFLIKYNFSIYIDDTKFINE